jgi:hypothetical protein
MFYGMLVALLILFVGYAVLDRWLYDHPVAFVVYWAACAWVTLLCVLLAIFDLLLVRLQARREIRRIAREKFQEAGNDDDPEAS